MSRSPFAARFSQLVEEPPLRYLTRWRMQKASRLIETSHAGLAVIGKRVGYDAEAAFSKAFKRYAGLSPGSYRHKLELRSRPEPRSRDGSTGAHRMLANASRHSVTAAQRLIRGIPNVPKTQHRRCLRRRSPASVALA